MFSSASGLKSFSLLHFKKQTASNYTSKTIHNYLKTLGFKRTMTVFYFIHFLRQKVPERSPNSVWHHIPTTIASWLHYLRYASWKRMLGYDIMCGRIVKLWNHSADSDSVNWMWAYKLFWRTPFTPPVPEYSSKLWPKLIDRMLWTIYAFF